jgi:hypothetical protein
MWLIARFDHTTYIAKNTTLPTASAIPAGSPCGPVVPPRTTTAAPATATADHTRNAAPGRSPNMRYASTPTRMGCRTCMSVTSTTDVALTATMNITWWRPNTTPARAVHRHPAALVRTPRVARRHNVTPPSSAAPSQRRQNDSTAPEVVDTAISSGPRLNITVPRNSSRRGRSSIARATAARRRVRPVPGVTEVAGVVPGVTLTSRVVLRWVDGGLRCGVRAAAARRGCAGESTKGSRAARSASRARAAFWSRGVCNRTPAGARARVAVARRHRRASSRGNAPARSGGIAGLLSRHRPARLTRHRRTRRTWRSGRAEAASWRPTHAASSGPVGVWSH